MDIHGTTSSELSPTARDLINPNYSGASLPTVQTQSDVLESWFTARTESEEVVESVEEEATKMYRVQISDESGYMNFITSLAWKEYMEVVYNRTPPKRRTIGAFINAYDDINSSAGGKSWESQVENIFEYGMYDHHQVNVGYFYSLNMSTNVDHTCAFGARCHDVNIYIEGQSCCGKTTLMKELSKRLGCKQHFQKGVDVYTDGTVATRSPSTVFAATCARDYRERCIENDIYAYKHKCEAANLLYLLDDCDFSINGNNEVNGDQCYRIVDRSCISPIMYSIINDDKLWCTNNKDVLIGKAVQIIAMTAFHFMRMNMRSSSNYTSRSKKTDTIVMINSNPQAFLSHSLRRGDGDDCHLLANMNSSTDLNAYFLQYGRRQCIVFSHYAYFSSTMSKNVGMQSSPVHGTYLFDVSGYRNSPIDSVRNAEIISHHAKYVLKGGRKRFDVKNKNYYDAANFWRKTADCEDYMG